MVESLLAKGCAPTTDIVSFLTQLAVFLGNIRYAAELQVRLYNSILDVTVEEAERSTLLHNLGGAYGSLGDHAKKRDLLERAWLIKERYYGADHVDVAATLDNFGSAYGSLGDNAKKRDLLERAWLIRERY